MRAAYDALDADMKARLEGLRLHHSIAHSRQTLGFEFSQDEQEALKGAVHPLARGTAASSAA
jgi:alpha-ketoglutarate-dependent 2,4-dichlorophenoxyacetate dioxygenase